MDHIRFNSGDMTIIIACAIGDAPSIIHWGNRLSDDARIDDMLALNMKHPINGSTDRVIKPSMAMEIGLGHAAPSGFEAHRDGESWGSYFTVSSAEQLTDSARIICQDRNTAIRLSCDLKVDPITGLIQLSSSITNISEDDGAPDLTLNKMASAVLPINEHMSDIIGFNGRWANEFQRERLKRFSGSYVRENRRGRTSHDAYPAIILAGAETNEQSGEAYGLQLAWSGNHFMRVDSLNDGQILASMGALTLPGEVRLKSGETYQSPTIVAAYSSNGLSALSRQFHDHVRNDLLRSQVRNRPRPVHYNSWEAIYFEHDIDTLKAMADKAAAIGIERFVLDDGWFGSRRDASSGLGDWVVSKDVYPQGLKPLIDHVKALGMEMGIWFEPEMVNPDSDVFRAHPDWILQIKGKEQVPFRGQYVLDIARPEVSEYIFNAIDAILSDHDIAYVKWDMNRDLNHPGDAQGYAKPHAHIMALYALIDRVRAKHPDVEIESCASGGARADYGILAHTDRVWTSDSNDALDRQNIQKGASYFLPLCVLGSHVGPAKCHITGRSLSMSMRAATAMMGHMGAELNLLSEAEEDLEALKNAITLYKQHRALIHSGDQYRLDTPDYLYAFGVIAKDKSEAIYSLAFLSGIEFAYPPMLRCDGLDPNRRYKLELIWPKSFTSSVMDIAKEHEALSFNGHYSGALLRDIGIKLPPSFPEMAYLIHIQEVRD